MKINNLWAAVQAACLTAQRLERLNIYHTLTLPLAREGIVN